jgi:SAM-dependent methyltransferase
VTVTQAEVQKFWRQRECPERGFTPGGWPWPYGEDLPERLAGWCPEGKVLDFGCGPGRMSRAFRPDRYTGMDINQSALGLARRDNPNHFFYLFDGDLLPADHVLAVEVLFHVHDDEIVPLCEKLVGAARRSVVIVEVFGRKWREGSDPMRSWHRDLDEYAEIAKSLGATQEVLAEIHVPRIDDVGHAVRWRVG